MLSIRNSLVTSGLAASLAVVLSAIAAYLAERKIVRLGGSWRSWPCCRW
jgi:ABC-type Fe3+ transport system permease subunit